MILIFIIGISFAQFGLYYLNEKSKTKAPTFIILSILLICNLFVFPRIFYPEPNPDGLNCGMPILGITLGFWIFGTIAGIVTHVVWKLQLRTSTKHNKVYKK
jgi:hypothetical protein